LQGGERRGMPVRQFVEGGAEGLPPQVGVLLGPAVVKPGDREALRRRRLHAPLGVDEGGLEAGGADIDAGEHQAAAAAAPASTSSAVASSVTRHSKAPVRSAARMIGTLLAPPAARMDPLIRFTSAMPMPMTRSLISWSMGRPSASRN